MFVFSCRKASLQRETEGKQRQIAGQTVSGNNFRLEKKIAQNITEAVEGFVKEGHAPGPASSAKKRLPDTQGEEEVRERNGRCDSPAIEGGGAGAYFFLPTTGPRAQLSFSSHSTTFPKSYVPAVWEVGVDRGKGALKKVFSGITLKSFMIQFLPR